MIKFKAYGDFKKAGIFLRNLATELTPVAKATLYETGELVLEHMKSHIDRQDLNWTPLADHTIKLKHGDDTVYVETGWLKDNLGVRRLTNKPTGSTIFVGASAWKKHPQSGLKFSDLLLFMEYGTVQTPARPLVRPTFEEVKKEIETKWKDVIIDLMKEG